MKTDGMLKRILRILLICLNLYGICISLCALCAIVYCSVKMRFQFMECAKSMYWQYSIEHNLTGINEEYAIYFLLIIGSFITLCLLKPIELLKDFIMNILKLSRSNNVTNRKI